MPDEHAPQPSAGPRPPLLSREEMGIIVILSALLLAGVLILQVREWVRTPLAIDRSGWADARYVIDLNTATWEEFALLPGIGEAKAKEIVAHRERIGGFKSADELVEVRGISRDMLARISHLVTVSQNDAGQKEQPLTPQ